MEEEISVVPEISTDWVLGMLDLWIDTSLEAEEMAIKLDYGETKESLDDEIYAYRRLREFVLKEIEAGRNDADLILSDFYFEMLSLYNNEFSNRIKQRYICAMNLISGVYENWDIALEETEML